MGVFLFANNVLAQVDLGTNVIDNSIALSNSDPRAMVSRIINIALGLLGVVAVSIVLVGGFKWMTSEGNEEKISEAKKILIAGVIGLGIILSAWGIASFVMSRLIDATQNGTQTTENNNGGGGGTGLPGGSYGSDCDNNSLMTGCQAGDCGDLICSPSSCKCLPGAGAPCGTLNNNVCAVNSTCGDGLKCGADSCVCEPCDPGDTSCFPLVSCNSSNVNGVCAPDDSVCTKGSCGDDCYCHLGQFGDPCDGDTNTAECEANNDKCDKSQGLACDANSCTCMGSPVITGLSPVGGFCENDKNKACEQDGDCLNSTCNNEAPNGAANSFVSIQGYNFGNASIAGASKILFLGASGDGDDKNGFSPASINSNCQNTWTNNQIITVVPSGAVSGPIKVVNGDIAISGLQNYDDTNDTLGPILPDFVSNTIARSGICKIDPSKGQTGTSVNVAGANLVAGNELFFGSYSGNVKAIYSSFAAADGKSGMAKVSNIAAGTTNVFVKKDKIKSNYLLIEKESDPILGPSISSFEPKSGAAGQYVTIRGAGFGKSKGASQVYFKNAATTTAASFDFPSLCLSAVWSDNQIIVKVPKGIADGAYNIELKITTWDINTSPSVFTVNSAATLLPSLCKIEPSMGPNNSPVNLWGEYFGNVNSNASGEFNKGKPFSANISNDNGTNKVSVTVPEQAITGPVKIGAGNSLNFTVGECKANADCGSGTPVCCPLGTAKKGQCAISLMDSNNGCYANVPNSVFEWTLNSGISCGNLDAAACANTAGCSLLDGKCVACESINTNACKTTTGCCLTVKDGADACIGGNKDANGKCATEGNWSCAYKGTGSNSCPTGACPNSPGQCSPYAGGQDKILGNCALGCNAIAACAGNKCTYNATLKKCILNAASCSYPIEQLFTYNPGSGLADISVYKKCVNFGWQIAVAGSCPVGWTNVGGGQCRENGSTCLTCVDGFDCNENGKCVSPQSLCSSDATCVNGSCVAKDQATCACCCEIGQDSRDCCAPLKCGSTCGNDTSDDGVGFGKCTGCSSVGTNPDENDAACNCSNSNGKFCSDNACVDCTNLKTVDDCQNHAAACCWDDRENNGAGVCRGGNGKEITTNKNDRANYGHCAYYGCSTRGTKTIKNPKDLSGNSLSFYLNNNIDNSYSPNFSTAMGYCRDVVKCSGYDSGMMGLRSDGIESVCSCNSASECKNNSCTNAKVTKITSINCIDCPLPCQAPSVWKAGYIYNSTSSCQANCDSSTICADINNTGNESVVAANCAANILCCMDKNNKCTAGDKMPDNNTKCAYYGCDDNCSVPSLTGSYLDKTECSKSCASSGLGRDCVDNLDNTKCDKSICGANFSCLIATGFPALDASDCGTCCCDPNAASDSCKTVNAKLSCYKDKGSCSGAGRGLCCGCSKDSECSGNGCGSDTCCDSRPTVDIAQVNPSVGAAKVCRNAIIGIPFSTIMDKATISKNVLVFKATSSCSVVASALQAQTENLSFWHRIYNKVASLFGNTYHYIARALNFEKEAIAESAINYCPVAGFIGVKTESDKTVINFVPNDIMDANTNYFIVVKGQTNLDDRAAGQAGVLSSKQIGMNGGGIFKLDNNGGVYPSGDYVLGNQTYGNSYIWSFSTMDVNNQTSGLCAVNSVAINPENYLFQSNTNDLTEVDNDAAATNTIFDTVADSDKVYTADALAANKQILHPVDGYAWAWEWSTAKNQDVFISNPAIPNMLINKTLIKVANNKIVDAKDDITAKIVMAAGNLMSIGNGFSTTTTAHVFVCSNPWPAIDSNGQWNPMKDKTSCVAGGSCNPFNYEFYYCRDAGDPNSKADDLNELGNGVIRGEIKICNNNHAKTCTSDADCGADATCISNLLKESYFFRQ